MILANEMQVEDSGKTSRLGAESGEKSLLFVPVFLPGMWMQCSEAQQLCCDREDKGTAAWDAARTLGLS